MTSEHRSTRYTAQPDFDAALDALLSHSTDAAETGLWNRLQPERFIALATAQQPLEAPTPSLAVLDHLDRFAASVHGVAHVVLTDDDGSPVATSSDLPPDRGVQLAALAAGFIALAVGTGKVFHGGNVGQLVLEMEKGYLLLLSVRGLPGWLTVTAAGDADIGVVSYETLLLAERLTKAKETAIAQGDVLKRAVR